MKVETRRLPLLGIGEVKANYHHPLKDTPKAITVKREGTKWWVGVRCVDVPAEPLAPSGREVGLDLGVTNLVATSDGERIEGEQFGSSARTQVTGQTCAACGHVDAGNRLSQAEFRCLSCNHVDHADVNAARNILRAGRAQQA